MTNALNQYSDLFLQHRDLIDANSAEPVNRLRDAALTSLEKHLLPKAGSENYELTSLPDLLAPDYGINVARVPLDVNPAASFRCGVPNLSTSLFLLVNDAWGETPVSRNQLPDGVEIGSLRAIARKEPELVAQYYGRLADMDNPLVALNSLLVQDGLWLRIRKGTRLERPLQLVDILHNGSPLMTLRRMLIILEEDTEAQLLICDHTQNPDTDFLNLQTIEIYAGRNARFDLYDLEESTERTTRLSTLYLNQEENSNVLIDGITLFNGNTRNEYHCTLKAPEASLTLLGMGIEDNDRRLDTYTRVEHLAPRCHSNQLFKYVVDDRARGAFAGRVFVDYGAVKTEAYQANRNLVGSGEARMFSKPQLEIYNDDVKCSHGTAIGSFDEKEVFYMRSRGLDLQQAHLLLKQAFMSDVIDGVRMPGLKERLHSLVERRFAGGADACASCRQCNK